MLAHIKPLTVIASAYRADASLLMNHKNHLAALDFLLRSNLHCTVAVGSWKEEGQDKPAQELSIVIEADSDSLPALQTLFLKTFKQDAILIIKGMEEQLASLLFNDGTSCELGRFQAIPEEEALQSECYTFIDGAYYVAKEAA